MKCTLRFRQGLQALATFCRLILGLDIMPFQVCVSPEYTGYDVVIETDWSRDLMTGDERQNWFHAGDDRKRMSDGADVAPLLAADSVAGSIYFRELGLLAVVVTELLPPIVTNVQALPHRQQHHSISYRQPSRPA